MYIYIFLDSAVCMQCVPMHAAQCALVPYASMHAAVLHNAAHAHGIVASACNVSKFDLLS
jgi:hypothetical protein